MLTKIVSRYFDRKIRARGADYARDGSVTSVKIRGDILNATVLGSEEYSIRIKRFQDADEWDLEVDCTCPYARDSSVMCKHVWATLVHAEMKIERVWGVAPAQVTFGEENGERTDEVDDFDTGEYIMENIAKLVGRTAKGTHAVPNANHAMPTKPKAPPWKRLLQETRPHAWSEPSSGKSTTPIVENIWYVIDGTKSRISGTLVVELMREIRGSDGETSQRPRKLVKFPIAADDVERIEQQDDRLLCALLVGAARPGREFYAYARHNRGEQRSAHWQLDPKMLQVAMLNLVKTDRLLWRESEEHGEIPASWSPESPWELAIQLKPQGTASDAKATLHPVLRRSNDEHDCIDLNDIGLSTDGDPGTAIHRGKIAPLRVAGGSSSGMLMWARMVAARPPTPVDRGEIAALLDALLEKKIILPIVWPDDWGPKRLDGVRPRPRLFLTTPQSKQRGLASDSLAAEIRFEYEGTSIQSDHGGHVSVKLADGTDAMVIRNTVAERHDIDHFVNLGGKRDVYDGLLNLPLKKVPFVVTTLLSQGWEVLRDAAPYRQSCKMNMRVTSGIDWFDLEGAAEFGDMSASIGAVLAALRKGEQFVSLGDGSLGLLPEEWLAKHGRWLGLGRKEGESVRFGRAQLSLVDALMAQMPEATCDKQFAAARKKLRAFAGIEPRTEPRSFRGELRPYQRQGLGWLHFLAEFGLGGCLADDMGLGKTVQLLAHVADRKKKSETGPWLVVAPKSLMFNWAREAERFTPGLAVINHTGPARPATSAEMLRADLVLTTYATMRMDIELLRTVEFECVVLDEAQSIKNASSQAATAARLLRTRRRLALTGTPVENRLEDLWSIFEFLNPGMLGSSTAFREVVRGGDDKDGMDILRRALRPFLLRRKKETVAPELPARTEQTVRCVLEGKQQTLYDGLRTHYQTQLLGRVDREGMNKSKMHVLEALLRLRQAACHPALLATATAPAGNVRRKQPPSVEESAKVKTLLHMLNELKVEGHKALVFSQFTSLLALVRTQLDRAEIGYEELDGSTSAKEREVRVNRFQSTPLQEGGKGVFLISLKAGGVGLNLTAAGYVFLLDPWWNPAVEAQAIDRTHRIGQDKSVIAYRLIATGTVEERMLELQERKRELAAAIISENAGPLSAMTREDLEWLLS